MLVRYFAMIIDLAIVIFACFLTLISALTGCLTGAKSLNFSEIGNFLPVHFCASVFIFFFYFTYLHMTDGMTAGKSIFHIKVVRTDGGKPGFLRALVRTAGYIASIIPCGAGFLLAFFGGRALHDYLAGTRVVKEDRLKTIDYRL